MIPKRSQFIIEKIEEDADFPQCPDCEIVLYEESKDLSNAQKAETIRWDNCDHIFEEETCIKCGFNIDTMHIPSARLMRCPKCGSLYHVERYNGVRNHF